MAFYNLKPFFSESCLNPKCKHEYLNAYSSLSYCIASYYTFSLENEILSMISVSIFMLGVGSFINHYWWNRLDAKLCDTSPMIITIVSTILSVLYKIFKEIHPNNPIYFIYYSTLTIIIGYVCLWLSISEDHFERWYLILYFVLVASLISLRLYDDYLDNYTHYGIYSLIVGVIFWKIDLIYYKELGQYGFYYKEIYIYPNFHVVWHILSSLSLYYCCMSLNN